MNRIEFKLGTDGVWERTLTPEQESALDKLQAKFPNLDYQQRGQDIVGYLTLLGGRVKEVTRFPVSRLNNNAGVFSKTT